MAMTEGKLDAGDFKLNIPMMDEALTRGKGYYEMLLSSMIIKLSYVLI